MDTSEIRLPDGTWTNAIKSAIKIRYHSDHVTFGKPEYVIFFAPEITPIAQKREASAPGASTCTDQINRWNSDYGVCMSS